MAEGDSCSVSSKLIIFVESGAQMRAWLLKSLMFNDILSYSGLYIDLNRFW